MKIRSKKLKIKNIFVLILKFNKKYNYIFKKNEFVICYDCLKLKRKYYILLRV